MTRHLQCPFGVQRQKPYERGTKRRVYPIRLLKLHKKGENLGRAVKTITGFCLCGMKCVKGLSLFLPYFHCDGTGRDGREGNKKCPSMFFILCGHLEHVYIFLYITRNKNCHQHSYGFQNWMSSWGVGFFFSILP